MNKARALAVRLLADEHGISEDAWKILASMLRDPMDFNIDIIEGVQIENGRARLPDSFFKFFRELAGEDTTT